MKAIINIVLALAIVGVGYLLYASIKEPIEFQDEKSRREFKVIDKLKQIRDVQEVYRAVTGMFAPSFDTLEHIIRTGKVAVLKVEGDPDDPTNVDAFTIDTSYYSALDTVVAMGILIDSIRYVFYSDGNVFSIFADTIEYQKTKVSVVEVGVQRKLFMGKYADPRYAKYDSRYDPESMIKFGNKGEPSTSGNWE